MEKLGQLHAQTEAEASWDLIIVDTPPSRSALDFLDAPEHLASLLDGRFVRMLLAPARGPARLLSVGLGVVTSALNKVLGAQVLTDMQTFIAACDTLFGGFRQRAEATYALLQASGTAFVVVATPEPDALREATYFVERLGSEHMPLAGLVVNRVQAEAVPAVSASAAERAAQQLVDQTGEQHEVAAGLLLIQAERARQRQRQDRLRKGFAGAHPEVPTVGVVALAGDVHDLDGLRQVGDLLAAG